MVFYVVYRASKEYRNRRLIPKRLKALGCRRIVGSFWEVGDEKVGDVLKVLEGNQPVLLKRLRETRKPEFDKEDKLTDFGSLVVFAYQSERKEETSKIKKLLKKAPYIRLCRTVYAFSREHSNYDTKGNLIDARRFWMFAQETGENVKVFPRMVIVNSESIPILLERITKRIQKGIDAVVMGYLDLYHRAAKGEIDRKGLHEEQLKLYRRFISIKKLAIFYKKWLGTDFSKIITKPYPVMRKIRSMNTE